LIERFPVVIYAGAAVLAGTAVKMILAEPLLDDLIDPIEHWSWVAYLALVGSVLAAGRAMQLRARKA
ncbi:MAG TPA: TerC family protein, partial [Burkholderiales bacterium]|nr:TerC family protein [Burkholderiales bacterium]